MIRALKYNTINYVRRNTHMLLCMVAVMSLSFVVGCGKSVSVMDDVERAESMLIDNPTEALSIMQSIDASEVTDRSDFAYYNLVYSEACYYNRMLVDSDSLTRISVDYYDNRNNHDRRARAYFQHAMVLQLSDSLPEAMLALSESLKSLDQHENLRLRGVVNRTMGDIYRARYCYPNSIEAYSKAYQCFKQLDLPYHCYYTRYNLGQAAAKMHSYNQAEQFFIEARDYAIETNDMNFLCTVLHELCDVYLQQKNYAKCSEVITLFEEYDCVLWFVSRYYAVRAIVSSELGNVDEARIFVAEAENERYRDEAIIEEAHYHIAKCSGDDDDAIYWLERINGRLDKMLVSAAEQPVLNYQIDLLQTSLEQEERQMKLSRQRNIAIYLALAILLTLIIGFLRGYASKAKRDIQQYIATIHELQLTTHASSDRLSEAVDKLYNDRLTDLNRLCETYYEHSDTARHASKVFEEVRQTIESIKSDEARIEELESLVNNCRGNIMRKLREQCPKLNSKELRVVLYSYAGFSSRAICIFMETNPVALSKTKYRIKLKIKECEAKDADLLISSIGDR